MVTVEIFFQLFSLLANSKTDRSSGIKKSSPVQVKTSVSFHLSLPHSPLATHQLPAGPKLRSLHGEGKSLFLPCSTSRANSVQTGSSRMARWGACPAPGFRVSFSTGAASPQGSRALAGRPSRLPPCPSRSRPQQHALPVPRSQVALTSLALHSLSRRSSEALGSCMSPNSG